MNNTETKTIVFTDGSSRGNPGPGGWGCVIVEPKKTKAENGADGAMVVELGGGEKHTTNNRMELTAAIEGISRAQKGSSVSVHTDSSYLINGITKWVHGWKKNKWQTKGKEDVLNRDLWIKLDMSVAERKVEWKYVGGHIGILGNERCDRIATAFADGHDPKLYAGPLQYYDLPDILDISHDQESFNKKKSSSKSRAKAHSYVSMVGGIVETHKSWAECERRVKGAKGAKYKKSFDADDEAEIKKNFIDF
jgi:ribonuclease HI